jgi:transcriptional regulator with XRE-family HTH domain
LAKYAEGPLLRTWIEPRVRAADIARAGGFSRTFVSQVLAGDARPSPRFLEACRDLGLPVDTIFGEATVERAPAERERAQTAA